MRAQGRTGDAAAALAEYQLRAVTLPGAVRRPRRGRYRQQPHEPPYRPGRPTPQAHYSRPPITAVMRKRRSSLISCVESTANCGSARRKKRASSGRSAGATINTSGAFRLS